MEMKSTILDPESNVIKKRKYDTEDSELIKVNPLVMSENAETLTRTAEKSSVSKTDCSSDRKAADQLNENKSQTNSSEFSGTIVAHVTRYIFGPRPPIKPGLFDCNKCSKNFKSLDVLNSHNTVQHVEKIYDPKKPFMCDICDRSFHNFKSLARHRGSKHKMPNPLYESKTCSSDSTIAMNKKQRKSSVSFQMKGLFRCSKCHRTFAKEKSLLSHFRHAHVKKPDNQDSFICDLCGKTFHLKKAIGLHRKHVHGRWLKKQRSF